MDPSQLMTRPFRTLSRLLLLRRGWEIGVNARITRGATARQTDVTEDHYVTEAWSLRPAWQLAWSVPAWRVRLALRSIRPARGALVCFRGRADRSDITGAAQMGPGPGGNGGRYNRPGESVLYLADSIDGVVREMRFWSSSCRVLCVQEYSVPLDDLNVADLATPEVSGLLTCAFDAAEMSGNAEFGSKDYAFSQMLAALVRRAGFSGMIVPGVRGAPGQTYRNVDLFSHRGWNSWCAGRSFQRVPMP